MSAGQTLLFNANMINRLGEQIDHIAVVIEDETIQWVGLEKNLPETYSVAPSKIDCQGHLLTPGLIDCHTHLVYAGHRAEEFKLKLKGASYETLAKKGGGILSTVTQTRLASEAALFQQSLPRLLAMKAEGVMTVEIKSGYGLDMETELKMLRVARQLGEATGVHVFTTFLGAHAIPPEYKARRGEYVHFVCEEVLPAVAEEQLADAVDVFCESIGFNIDESTRIFEKAQALNLPIKCHAEQLSNLGASKLASSYGALSAEHLEYIDEQGIQAMSKAGVVAVLLPGAFYFLKETTCPPIESFRENGVGMAIATDCNPGSSPTTSIQLMLNMACQYFSLTVEEALSGVTYQAARALALDAQIGSIEPGKKANLLMWPVKDSAELCYTFGTPRHPETLKNGQWTCLTGLIK